MAGELATLAQANARAQPERRVGREMRRIIVFVLAVSLCFLWSGSIQAEREIESLLKLGHRLELSDAQRSQMEDLVRSVRKDRIRRQADLHVAEIELEELLNKEKVDLSKVRGKLKEMESLRTDLKFAGIKAWQDGLKLLNEEQWKRLRGLEPRDRREWFAPERMERWREEMARKHAELMEKMRVFGEELKERQREMEERIRVSRDTLERLKEDLRKELEERKRKEMK